MTIHRLKLKDLNVQFIQQLKAAYSNEETEITFWLNPISKSVESVHLTEDKFWSLIEQLDWEKQGDNNAVITPLVKQLSTLSIDAIRVFEDILSEKLYRLDGKVYAQNIGERAYQENKYFSVDNFLYARCCVVANGKEFYEEVLKNPSQMPKDLSFGALLRVAAEAYELKTEEKFKYIPKYIYETYANAAAWGSNNFVHRILGA